jgi:hypothetical protein
MKKMKIIRFFVIVASLLLVSAHAWATPVTLNLGGAPQPQSGGDPQIQTWLLGLIDTYNANNNPDLPTNIVGVQPDLKVITGDIPPNPYPSFGQGTLSINLPMNANNYLVLHWGGNVYQAFYFAQAETFAAPAPGQNGLSFYSIYGSPVPIPGAVWLLGSGLLGLLGVKRKLQR